MLCLGIDVSFIHHGLTCLCTS
uniref:Uncharacterized protein n=1 Tax=Arundo donax TaxID=35708 RepID=A0A0A8YSA3_ARUDO